MQQAELAQLEYKKRHDKVAATVHCRLYEKYGLPRSEQWYRHTAESVIETKQVKIHCDVSIQTDHVTEHRWADTADIEDNKTTLLIDITVSGDTRVEKDQDSVHKC